MLFALSGLLVTRALLNPVTTGGEHKSAPHFQLRPVTLEDSAFEKHMRGLYVIVKWVFLGKEKQGRNLFKKFTCVLRACLIAQLVKNLPAMQEPPV